MKKFISFLLVLTLLMTVMPVTSAQAAVKINNKNLSLSIGESYTLKITGTKSAIKWSSSDEDVATVNSKGGVLAISEGNTVITAKVKSKKYTCKVNVQSGFNAADAKKNLTEDITDTGNGIIDILTNNNKYNLRLEATIIYYDANGLMLGKSSADSYNFEKGTQCALYFYPPTDGDYNNVAFNSCKIAYNIEETASISNQPDINISSNIGSDNVMAEVTNIGKQSAEYTVVTIVFYKNGHAIAWDERYANCKSSGASDVLEFSFPEDNNYDTIQIDDYKIFVNESYRYD